MTKLVPNLKRISSALLACTAILLLTPQALEAQRSQARTAPAPDAPTIPGQEIWNDPQFVRQFTASYGTRSPIEPRISSEEQEKLRELAAQVRTDMRAAAETLRAAITDDSSAILTFTLGNFYFQLNRLNDAERQYAAAIRRHPDFMRAHKNLGLLHVRRGNFEQAIPSLSKAIELGGGDAYAYGLLGFSHMQMQRYGSAESAYRDAILYDPDNLEWRTGLARIILAQERFDEAITLYADLLKNQPENIDFWLLQARAYLGKQENMQAASNYEMIRRLNGANAEILMTLGDLYHGEGFADLAAEAYHASLEMDPNQPINRPMRAARILIQHGAWDDAESMIEQIRANYTLSSTQELALLKHDAKIALGRGEGEDAIDLARQIIARDPLDGQAILLLARHHKTNGDIERARMYYDRAAQIREYQAEAFIEHAQLHVEQKNYREAVRLLNRAQEVERQDHVAQFLEQVQRIHRITNRGSR